MSPGPLGRLIVVTDPTFVLIPGAGGRAWYWHRLVAELHKRGRAAVAVDLPADDDAAGLEEYADTVLDAARDIDDVVVVAQSLGGFTGPLVCARRPVRALVLLNAMVPRPGETPGDWWANTGHEDARRAAAAREGWSLDVLDSFLHDLPPQVRAEALAQGEPAQSSTPFIRPWPLQAWPDVPTWVLHGRDDRFFPVEFQRRIVAERLGLDVHEIPGGHLAALSRPTELASVLEAGLEPSFGTSLDKVRTDEYHG
jgi:pimeloyl-ACP methyl ester carboxylesterase